MVMRALLLFLLLLVALPSHAATLRVSSAGDAGTMDPHSQNIIPTAQLLRQIYEQLVGRGSNLELEPALALSWESIAPDRWRFHLRPGVKFHEGQDFTADDVLFSLARVQMKTSNYGNFADTVKKVEAMDPLTVDITTEGPDPILPDKLASVAILSRSWCVANHAEEPQNATQKEESVTARRTNGTGPFMLKSREEGTRTVLTVFPGWWGKRGNVDEYVSLPIANAATRVAALLSGEVDVLLDPPLQAIDKLLGTKGIRVLQGPEIRSMFLVMDQGRDELLYSDVKGRNPFKDIRVRRALYEAIDIEAIRSRIMRGFAQPAGIWFGPGVRGYDAKLDTRLPHDPQAAKALLSEAGYPDGFGVTLDCPNNRYINDADVCTAIAAMWARIGVRAEVDAQPLAIFFPKVQRRNTSLFFLGSGSATLDAYYAFQIHLLPAQSGRPGDGNWNLGGYMNPALNAAVERFRAELDPAKRNAEIADATRIARDDIANIPLYHQLIAWAVRDAVEVQIRADNELEARFVHMK
jgi:peptide/nickel transport system substrate-binding protein